MAIVPPLDEDLSTWLRSSMGSRFAEHYEALRDKVVELDTGGGGSTSAPLKPQALLASPASSIGFSGLDGNADGGYQIVFQLTNAIAGSTNVRLRVNGSNANISWARGFFGDQNTSGSSYVANGSPGANGVDYLNGTSGSPFASMQYGNDIATVVLDVDARTGKNRMFRMTYHAGTTVAYRVMVVTAIWFDTSTNITSLDLDDAAGTNRFATGSLANIWRVAYGG